MKAVFLLQTVIGDEGTLAAETEHEFDDAEAERLIGLGVGIDPAMRIVEAPVGQVTVQTVQDAVAAAQAESAEVIVALEAQLADANAALAAAHAEIDRLTAAVAAVPEKKGK